MKLPLKILGYTYFYIILTNKFSHLKLFFSNNSYSLTQISFIQNICQKNFHQFYCTLHNSKVKHPHAYYFHDFFSTIICTPRLFSTLEYAKYLKKKNKLTKQEEMLNSEKFHAENHDENYIRKCIIFNLIVVFSHLMLIE